MKKSSGRIFLAVGLDERLRCVKPGEPPRGDICRGDMLRGERCRGEPARGDCGIPAGILEKGGGDAERGEAMAGRAFLDFSKSVGRCRYAGREKYRKARDEW